MSLTTPCYKLYPLKQGHLGDLRKLNTKQIRESWMSEADKIICIYKIGLILTPGEVLNWTSKLRKLTSVRHRSTLLRVAHGEIYSNSRLFKFGLIANPSCQNCGYELETITHKIIECPTAMSAWNKMNQVKTKVGLGTGPLNLEQIMGTTIETSEKLSLTLNAELLQLIISQGGKSYDSENIVQRAIKSILINETLPRELRTELASCVNS